MRHNRGTFFHELTPLAKAIDRVTAMPKPAQKSLRERAAEGVIEHAKALDKRAAKLARRAARAGHKVPTP